MLVYGVIGVFGAARYGRATEGNVLMNSWLGGKAEGVLHLAVAAYLSISLPPMALSLRYTLVHAPAALAQQPKAPATV